MPALHSAGVAVWIKRDDLLRMGPGLALCGNKWRKLKYNLAEAQSKGYAQILTFGGAFSNHIAAVAGAGAAFGFRTIGVIRGEAPPGLNPTLRFAERCGMNLHFVSRTTYRQKEDFVFHARLEEQFGPYYLSPEGGTNRKSNRWCPGNYQRGAITATGSSSRLLVCQCWNRRDRCRDDSGSASRQ